MSALAMAPELQLPWESSAQEDRRFHRLLGAALLVFTALAVLVPLLPVAELTREKQEAVPPHLARVILEKKELPPPAPPVPKPKPVEKKPEEKPPEVESPPERAVVKKVDRVQQARDQAKVAGVLAFRDELMDMRDSVDLASLDQTHLSRGEASAEKLQRSVITSPVQQGSGGIKTAALSRDTGGPALSGREATRVESSMATDNRRRTAASQSAQMGGRSDESIRRVMDSNKGAIFAIYNRALRRDPLLEGKLVFEMVIDASGAVVDVELVSSGLADEALTRKILSRIRLIQFGAESVQTTRVNYSLDFLPYA